MRSEFARLTRPPFAASTASSADFVMWVTVSAPLGDLAPGYESDGDPEAAGHRPVGTSLRQPGRDLLTHAVPLARKIQHTPSLGEISRRSSTS